MPSYAFTHLFVWASRTFLQEWNWEVGSATALTALDWDDQSALLRCSEGRARPGHQQVIRLTSSEMLAGAHGPSDPQDLFCLLVTPSPRLPNRPLSPHRLEKERCDS